MNRGIRFSILSNGTMEHDLAWSYAMQNPGTVHDKHTLAEWGTFPILSVLIDHPDYGYILYDTGCCPGDDGPRRTQKYKDLFVLHVREDDFINKRLEEFSLTPDDISMIVLSHTHWDHSGGLTFFSNTKAGQNVMVSEKDYMTGLKITHQTPLKDTAAYIKDNFEFEGLSYTFVDEDQELVPGIDMVMLYGHTPGIIGLVVHLDSGTVIFPSDSVYSSKSYGPPAIIPGIIYDTVGFEKSIKKLRLLQKKYNAEIFFPHDMEQFRSLKLSPHFYT